MKDKTEIQKEISEQEQQILDDVKRQLATLSNIPYKVLSSTISAICSVDEKPMLSGIGDNKCKQARYLYWYAIKYMTKCSNQTIAKHTHNNGKRYTTDGVRKGLECMRELIYGNRYWSNKWDVVKMVVSAINEKHITEEEIREQHGR